MIFYLFFLTLHLQEVSLQPVDDVCAEYLNQNSCQAEYDALSCIWTSSQQYCGAYNLSENYNCIDLPAVNVCTTHKQTDLFCENTTSCQSTSFNQVPCTYVNMDEAYCYKTTQECFYDQSGCLDYNSSTSQQCSIRSQGACKQLASNNAGQFCLYDTTLSKCKDDDPNKYLCSDKHSQMTCYTNTHICAYIDGKCSNYVQTNKNYVCSQLPQSMCETHIQPDLLCKDETTCADDIYFTQHQCSFSNQNKHSCFETQYQGSIYCVFSLTNKCVNYQSGQIYNCNQLTKYTCEQHVQTNLFCVLDPNQNDTCLVATYQEVNCNNPNLNKSTCTNSSKNCVWNNKCQDYDSNLVVSCDQLSSISCQTHIQPGLFCQLDSNNNCVAEQLNNVLCSHQNQDATTCLQTTQKCVFQGVCQDGYAVQVQSCSIASKGYCNLVDTKGVFCKYNTNCVDDDPNTYPCNSHHSQLTCYQNPFVCAYEQEVCTSYNNNTQYQSCQSLPAAKCENHQQSGFLCHQYSFQCQADYNKYDCSYKNQNQSSCFQTSYNGGDNGTVICVFVNKTCKQYVPTSKYSCDELAQYNCMTHKQFDLFCGLNDLNCVTISYQDVSCEYQNLNASTCVKVTKQDCAWQALSNQCQPYDSTLNYECLQLPLSRCESHKQQGLYCGIVNGTCTSVSIKSKCELVNIAEEDCLKEPPSCYWSIYQLCQSYSGTYPIKDISNCSANYTLCPYIDNNNYCISQDSKCIQAPEDTPIIQFNQTNMNKLLCNYSGHFWNSTSLICQNSTQTDCSLYETMASCINQYQSYQFCSWNGQSCQDERLQLRKGEGCSQNMNIQACLYSSAQCVWIPPQMNQIQGCYNMSQISTNMTCLLTSARGCEQQTATGLKCSITYGRCGDLQNGQTCNHGLNKEACLSLQNCVYYGNKCQFYYSTMKDKLSCSAYPTSLCLTITPPYPMHMCAIVNDLCTQLLMDESGSISISCSQRNLGACLSNQIQGGPCLWINNICSQSDTQLSLNFENCHLQNDGPHYLDYETIQCITPTADDWKMKLNCLHPGLNEEACLNLNSALKNCTWDSVDKKCS